jgi:hypothetical protein
MANRGRPPISWEQLELPFGEWAAGPRECRVSAHCDPLSLAEQIIGNHVRFLRWISRDSSGESGSLSTS